MNNMLFTFGVNNSQAKFIEKLGYRYEIIFKPIDWDDYGFKTIFEVLAIDVYEKKGSHFNHISLGSIKIGYIRQKENSWTFDHPYLFNRSVEGLSSEFFSVGVDSSYYDKINYFFGFNSFFIREYYAKIQDIAFNQRILRRIENELVFSNSFLRSTSYENIIYQYSFLVKEFIRKNDKIYEDDLYNSLSYEGRREFLSPILKMGISINIDGSDLGFYLDESDSFKNNIYTIIGSNGSGKSKLLDKIVGDYLDNKVTVNDLKNIVLVTFSPFDKLTSYKNYIKFKKNNRKSVRFIGLRRELNPDEFENLNYSFFKSLGNCLISADKRNILRITLNNLYSDPIFKSSEIIKILNLELSGRGLIGDFNLSEQQVINQFEMLSSGHKIVLYTILKLVDLVDLNTLVLFDEPELYLHPPLLSSFIRSISDLLIENNAMAIITTHSPIVLQEIPRKYIKIIKNIEGETIYKEVDVNTFGERVDVLTNEIFNLEVYESGYYKLLHEYFNKIKGRIINVKQGYELFEFHFNGELGTEAKKIVVSLINNYLEDNRGG